MYYGSCSVQDTVPVPVPVPAPAPYLDNEKHSFQKKKNFVKNLTFLMLIEAALLPINLLNEGNHIPYTILYRLGPTTPCARPFCTPCAVLKKNYLQERIPDPLIQGKVQQHMRMPPNPGEGVPTGWLFFVRPATATGRPS